MAVTSVLRDGTFGALHHWCPTANFDAIRGSSPAVRVRIFVLGGGL